MSEIELLKKKLDSWRNEANNTFTELKQEIKDLNDDFIKLGKLAKDILTRTIEESEEVLKCTEKDGIVRVNTSLPLYPDPVNFDKPTPALCRKCGTVMIVDISTLNKIDWYCPECCKKNPTSALHAKLKKRKKKKWTWVRDYLLSH